jgi:hypothetical protein
MEELAEHLQAIKLDEFNFADLYLRLKGSTYISRKQREQILALLKDPPPDLVKYLNAPLSPDNAHIPSETRKLILSLLPAEEVCPPATASFLKFLTPEYQLRPDLVKALQDKDYKSIVSLARKKCQIYGQSPQTAWTRDFPELAQEPFFEFSQVEHPTPREDEDFRIGERFQLDCVTVQPRHVLPFSLWFSPENPVGTLGAIFQFTNIPVLCDIFFALTNAHVAIKLPDAPALFAPLVTQLNNLHCCHYDMSFDFALLPIARQEHFRIPAAHINKGLEIEAHAVTTFMTSVRYCKAGQKTGITFTDLISLGAHSLSGDTFGVLMQQPFTERGDSGSLVYRSDPDAEDDADERKKWVPVGLHRGSVTFGEQRVAICTPLAAIFAKFLSKSIPDDFEKFRQGKPLHVQFLVPQIRQVVAYSLYGNDVDPYLEQPPAAPPAPGDNEVPM